jgi:lipid II:glycine glycyltransferase (peptidoglycan interpeptide bridge formation enzyme)
MIRLIKSQEELEANLQLPVFATESYLKCKAKDIGWFESDNYIIPFIFQRKLIFKWLTFTYKPIEKKKTLTYVDQKEFLEKIVDYLKEKNLCDFINKAQAYVLFDAVPDSSDSVEYGTFKMTTNKSDEDILMGCHHKHRSKIRKALREEVVIKDSDDILLVYENIRNTMVRQNSVFYPSLEYLTNLKQLVPNKVKFFVSEKQNKVQGVAVLVFDDYSGYYMFGGSIPKPATGAINLLHFEILKFLRENKITYYDFVGARIHVEKGSKYDGIQRFKKGFGAEMVKGYTFRSVINPYKYLLFNTLIKIYGEITGNKSLDVISQIKIQNKVLSSS